MSTVSVVIPVFNEQEVLPALWAQLVPVLERCGLAWEVLFVDDGSRDASWELLTRMRGADERVTLVKLSRNFGHQMAISAGLTCARGDAVIVMDADLQDPPELILKLIEHWREGYDVVYAVRTERRGEGAFKRGTAWAYQRLLDALSPVEIPVDTGDFRLMSRRTVDALNQMPERARFVRGMVAWLGYRQIGVPFTRQGRHAGITKYPLRKMLSFAADGIFSFSTVPLRMVTIVGFGLSMASMGYLSWAVLMVWLGRTVHGWASLIAVMAFIGSAQLISLGIIGEYVARIYREVKQRPLYLVDVVQQGSTHPARQVRTINQQASMSENEDSAQGPTVQS